MIDLVITGPRVVDGTGAPWFRADVAIAGDRIAAVGTLSAIDAPRVDANDLVLAPGFIDAHVHSETRLLRDPHALIDARQGITTHIAGQDGVGIAPTDEATVDFMHRTLAFLGRREGAPPRSVGDLLTAFDGASTVNVATLVPNGCVRMMVMGTQSGRPAPEQLEAMTALCREGMAEGAVGLSSGLDYVPSGYADTDELTALAAAIAPFGGVYVSHVRYRRGLLAAIDEALEIGRRSGAPPHISHLMAEIEHGIEPATVLSRLDEARAAGIDVSFDLYPYPYGCTTLLFVLPHWMLAGSSEAIVARLADPEARRRLRAEVEPERDGWGEIELAGTLGHRWAALTGLDLLTASERTGLDPVDLVCDVLREHHLDVMLIGSDPADPRRDAALEPMLAHPAHMFGSDGIHVAGRAHPRTYGAAARFIGRFVRERGVLSLEEAVQHATSFPARRYGLLDRGLVRAGFAADLVLFDPCTLTDRATRTHAAPADGVRDVWVNGVAVLRDGTGTGALPGRGLRRSQSAGAEASTLSTTVL